VDEENGSTIHKRQSPHPSASPPPSPLGKANTGIPFVQIAETLISFGTFSTRKDEKRLAVFR